ncbi:CAP domain-containing protein [Rhodopirellula halodulae]|uniref:CAP domain-containing protein n=1 Tax=Rhodopirellula halodulae TaxID=2894198 RepID=UPI001E3E80F6|nr:CAP domain-containing protein [Rhodopirellula sp. JC737]MCC9657236.1 CAP domain-containing protein [Rhodopirellula sp. JC737]
MRSLIAMGFVWLMVGTLSGQEDVQTTSSPDDMVREVERAIVARINDYRDERELAKLQVNKTLQKTAKKFATFMAESGKYGHQADGNTPAERAAAEGYEYCVVRENIAYRTNTAEVTAKSLTEVFVPGWIESPPHHENIVAPHITQTAAAVATEDGVTYYAVHLFGRPKSEQIEISVINDSGKTQTLSITTNDSVDQIEMPRRTTLKLTRCFPTTFRVKGRDGEKEIRKSAELTLTKSGWKVSE